MPFVFSSLLHAAEVITQSETLLGDPYVHTWSSWWVPMESQLKIRNVLGEHDIRS